MKNDYVPIAQEQVASKIDEAGKIDELFREIADDAPKSENGKRITDMEEFRGAWEKGLEEWYIAANILEEHVGGCREMDNRELEAQKVNIDIEESQLEIRQYKLAQRNETYSSERSQKIIEQSMPGMRKEIPKGGTYN